MILYSKRACGALYRFLVAHRGCYLLPVNTCPVVPLTLLKAGCSFKLIDICFDDLCINQEDVVNELKNNPQKYKGVIFIHTYGCEYDVTNFAKTIKLIDDQIQFIEDKCLCFPDINQKNVPFYVDMVLYSTGYYKSVDIGEGGWSISNDYDYEFSANINYIPEDYKNIELYYKRCFSDGNCLKNIEDYNWLDITLINSNDVKYYIDKVASAAEKALDIKRRINVIYENLLPKHIQFASKYNQWRFNICLDNSVDVLNKIFKSGLFASRHYQPVSSLFYTTTHFQKATELYNSTLNLFNDKYFTEDKALRISNLINAELNKNYI